MIMGEKIFIYMDKVGTTSDEIGLDMTHDLQPVHVFQSFHLWLFN